MSDPYFNHKTRERFLNHFKSEDQVYDLVVIGGGITGAGVARDAASRGMSVALVEANDFAFGTSSRSSKLIHGGIRYLENLEFGLVFEALTERSRLFHIAPYLVHPLRFMLPVYRDSRVGMFKMGLGMWLYDALALFEVPQMHEHLSPHQSVERFPLLNQAGLKGSYVYSDAYMDDDRLVHETLRSAHSFGARSVNYVSATGALFDEGSVCGIECTDRLTQTNFSLKAKHVVSTVGPWTDDVGHRFFDEDWKDVLRPSKGIHLTLHRDRLPLENAVVMVSNDQKRIIFGIPRHEMIIIGTTDTDFKADPASVHTKEQDVDYLLDIVNQYFPGANISKNDVLASYAGVRPLVHDGSSSESKTSREHVILNDPRNVTFVAGGKYTTYRHMAEETVESVLAGFSAEERAQYAHSRTKEPLNPLATVDSPLICKSLEWDWARQQDVPIEIVRQLSERHGEETPQILSHQMELPAKDFLLWRLELQHAMRTTMCLDLLSFYLRRTPLFLSRKDHGYGMREPLAEQMAQELGWSEDEKHRQIQALEGHLQEEMAWKPNVGGF